MTTEPEDRAAAVRLTSEQVRTRSFRPVEPGLPGLDEEDVSAFMTVTAHELAVLTAERDEARDYATRLSNGSLPEVHDQAANLLARAQQNAERLIAEARATAAEIAHDARQAGRDLVNQAKVHADQVKAGAVREAATEAAMAAASAPAALKAELLALRTVGSIMRTHMRSYFESGLASVTEWERQAEAAVSSLDLSDWSPPADGRPAGDRPG